MGDRSGEEFWNWALRAYARDGVAPAALALQDRHGACVMVLMCLCWRASRGLHDSPGSITALVERAMLIERHVLVPLRAARRVWKRGVSALPGVSNSNVTAALADAELSLERLQACRIADCASASLDTQPSRPAGPRAQAALVLYLGTIGMHGAVGHSLAQQFASLALER